MEYEEEEHEPVPVVRRPRVLTAVCIFWLLSSILQLLLAFLVGLISFRKAEIGCCCPTGLYFSLQIYFFVLATRILMDLSRTTLVAAIISAILGVLYAGIGMFYIIEEYIRPPVWFRLTIFFVAICLFGIWHILAGVLAAYYNGPYRRWALRFDPRPDVDQNDDRNGDNGDDPIG